MVCASTLYLDSTARFPTSPSPFQLSNCLPFPAILDLPDLLLFLTLSLPLHSFLGLTPNFTRFLFFIRKIRGI